MSKPLRVARIVITRRIHDDGTDEVTTLVHGPTRDDTLPLVEALGLLAIAAQDVPELCNWSTHD